MDDQKKQARMNKRWKVRIDGHSERRTDDSGRG